VPRANPLKTFIGVTTDAPSMLGLEVGPCMEDLSKPHVGYSQNFLKKRFDQNLKRNILTKRKNPQH
jgi:hypothetical protein